MDLRGTLQRMLRLILACIAAIMILLVCICVGLGYAIGTPLLNLFPFQNRRNVSSIEFNDGTSEDEHLTSPKSTTPSSDDTASKRTSTFSDSTETGNIEKEKVPEKINQISTKENVSRLEGLALQMAQLEQDRMSTDMSRSSSSSEFCVRSPNESLSVKRITPKSVLKSPCSDIKTSPNRGTRRIRFQDAPTYEVCTGSSTSIISRKKSSHSSSCSKQRRISPAPYLKADLSFSPSMSSKTKIRTTDKITRNAPKINLSSETASDQKQVNAEIDILSENSKVSIPTSFSSETADNEHMSNESMEHLQEESLSTTVLSSEITSNQQVKNELTDSLSNELKLSNLSVLPAKTTDQQESKEPIDSLSEVLSSNSTVLPYYETATSQPSAEDNMSFLSKESYHTVPAACKELEESAQVGDQCFEQEIIESSIKFKSDKLLSGHASQEISTQVKQKKDGELLCESSGKDVLSTKEKEYFKRDTEDIHQFTEDSKIVDSLQISSLLPESAICQKTAEVINENLDESTPTNELNPNINKTDDLCKSLEYEDHFQQGDTESITDADRKQMSEDVITQRIKKRNGEEISDHSSEEADRISTSEEDVYFKIEEGKLDDSQDLKTADLVLQSEDSTSQPYADESTYL